jgi:hypothetical protein
MKGPTVPELLAYKSAMSRTGISMCQGTVERCAASFAGEGAECCRRDALKLASRKASWAASGTHTLPSQAVHSKARRDRQ